MNLREMYVVVRADSDIEAETQALMRMEGEGWTNVSVGSTECIEDDKWRVEVQGEVTDAMIDDLKIVGQERTSKYPLVGRDATVPLRQDA